MPSPRLLNIQQASEYLNVPLASIRRSAPGRMIIDGRIRWDRHALDAWINAEVGLGPPSAANENSNDAEDALNEWLAHSARNPRRS